MSANRSVLAAQRRRAGPTNAEPAIPGRSPQPSINSSQMFASQANQGKQTSGLKQQQQPQQYQQQPKSEGLSSVSKMTIPQAITLITLRLGAVETKLMNIQDGHSSFTNGIQMEGQENMVLIDSNVIQSITSRLESLEKRSSSSSGSASGPEMNLLKQQVDTVKQAVIKSNSVTTNLAKDNRDLKIQVENLKTELFETKELLQALQNLTMDNSQKILGFSMNMSNDEMLELGQEQIDCSNIEDLNDINDNNSDNNDKNDDSEFVTGDLKKLIENEINSTI